MINLVQNELLKLVRKRKIWIVSLIMAVLISMFTYAQFRDLERKAERYGSADWRTTLQQQIIDTQNRLSSSRSISDEWRQQLEIRIQQQQYYLEHDINPAEPGAPTFVRGFMENAVHLLLPLFVIVIAADLVSSEHSLGTIKLLLTRPVKRWRVLLGKYLTLILAISLIVFIFGALSYIISGFVFGFGGWTAPVLMGFMVEGGELNTANVSLIPQWQYILMQFSLGWFVAIVVGTLSFMLSVLIRSTAAGMGIMLASLISGTILSNMVSSWESAKYLFMVNLNLVGYLSGQTPPIEGISFGFSFTVLLLWGLVGLIISFARFTRQDVY